VDGSYGSAQVVGKAQASPTIIEKDLALSVIRGGVIRNGVCEGSNGLQLRDLCGIIPPTIIKRELSLSVKVNKVKEEGY
jgi:hypothetical protein